MVTKEALSDLKEKYAKAENLIEEESKLDPPTEPYKSHYAAQDILIELQNNIKNTMQTLKADNQADDLDKYTFILAHILVDLGKIAMFTEEPSNAERYLQQGVDLLSEFQLNPSAVCAYLNGLNQCGILWTNRNNAEKAKEFLIKAEETYTSFKASQSVPLTIYDLFGPEDEIESGKGSKLLEKTNTLTLFYLAQVFGTLGDLKKSAVYCHTTLKKQMQSRDYEPIDWALNAATLSQYFCTNNRYTEVNADLLFMSKSLTF